MRRRYLAGALVLLVLLAGALTAGLRAVAAPPLSVPTTRPERGDVEVRIHARGEIAPHQSMSLSAPAVGGQLQLVRLMAAGTIVRKDDVVMAFDPESQRHSLVQARSELAEADEEIRKLQADSRVRAAVDELALVEARFEVKLAEVRVSGHEFVGTIEARKNELALEEAQRKVEQLERDLVTRAAGSEAALAALREKRRKAELAIALAERNIENMTVRAPIDGMVTINQNQSAMGNFGFPGMTIPEYREGDSVQPGSPVAALIDLSAVEVNARLDESARTALAEDTAASVRIDALPIAPLEAKVKRLGGTAMQAFFWDPSSREFDASFRIDRPVPALRPGMTATLTASAEPLRDVLHLPRQAVFQREGRPIVYVRHGDDFEPREVKVVRYTESRVVLEGVAPEDDVALADPERSSDGGRTAAAPPVPGA